MITAIARLGDALGLRGAGDILPGAALPLTSKRVIDILGGGIENASGVRVNRDTALGYPAFWRGVTLLAETAARVPLVVYKNDPNGGRAEDREHPASWLLRKRANEVMSGYTFRQTIQHYASVSGNGLALIIRSGLGEPVELLPLEPGSAGMEKRGGQWLYFYDLGGRRNYVLPHNVLHIKGVGDGVWGVDPVARCNETLGLGLAAQRFGAAFFKNSAMPKVVIQLPERVTMDDEDVKTFRKNWYGTHGGPDKAHVPAITQDGAKVDVIQQNNEESQLVELRESEIRIGVANILGVPAFLLGDTTSTSYNSLEILTRVFSNFTMGGPFACWKTEAEWKLLRTNEYRADTHSIDWTLEALEQADKKTETESLEKQLNSGMLTLNEVRRIKNRPTVEGGDAHRIPVNIAPDMGAAPQGGDRTSAAVGVIVRGILNDLRPHVLRAAKTPTGLAVYVDHELEPQSRAWVLERLGPVYGAEADARADKLFLHIRQQLDEAKTRDEVAAVFAQLAATAPERLK